MSVRDRLTYANVVATLALFLALTGGAVYAADKIGSSDIARDAVRAKHIRTDAVRQAELKAASVGESELQANAVAARNLQDESVGNRELKIGGIEYENIDPNAVSPRLFAHVSSSGVLGEQSGVESVSHPSVGNYGVRFNRDLRGCVAVATVGFGFGPGVIGAGATAQARMNLSNDPNSVGVTIYRNGYTFSSVENDDFHLIVAC